MKFRKKSVIVEAEQFFPTFLHWPEGVELYKKEQTENINGVKNIWNGWRIKTLEGVAEVTPGDWNSMEHLK